MPEVAEPAAAEDPAAEAEAGEDAEEEVLADEDSAPEVCGSIAMQVQQSLAWPMPYMGVLAAYAQSARVMVQVSGSRCSAAQQLGTPP